MYSQDAFLVMFLWQYSIDDWRSLRLTQYDTRRTPPESMNKIKSQQCISLCRLGHRKDIVHHWSSTHVAKTSQMCHHNAFLGLILAVSVGIISFSALWWKIGWGRSNARHWFNKTRQLHRNSMTQHFICKQLMVTVLSTPLLHSSDHFAWAL